MVCDEYSDIGDVVVLIIRLRHLPRFPDADWCGRMVTDVGIDDEGNAGGNLFTLVSDTPSTHFLSQSNVSVSDRKVAKPFLGVSLSGTLVLIVLLIHFQWMIDGASFYFKS